MVDWEYVGLFYEPGGETDCAVPDFFPLGGKHVLLFSSHQKGVQYYIGEYSLGRFEPVRHGRMNFGSMGLETGNLLAAYTLLDGSGRRVLFGWVSEGRQEEAQRRLGWSGTMCLPRVLSLAPDGLLQQEPIDEVRTLRREHVRVTDMTVADGSVMAVRDAAGDCLEIAAEVDVGAAREFGVKVLCSPDETEQTVISYSRESSTLSLDVEKCSLDPTVVGREVQSARLDLDEGEPLRLRDIRGPFNRGGVRKPGGVSYEAGLPRGGRQRRDTAIRQWGRCGGEKAGDVADGHDLVMVGAGNYAVGASQHKGCQDAGKRPYWGSPQTVSKE